MLVVFLVVNFLFLNHILVSVNQLKITSINQETLFYKCTLFQCHI